MASLTRQKGKYYHVFWNFKVAAGPKAGQTIQGSAYLGSCTRAAAKVRLREVEVWEEAVKTGRHLPDGGWEEVYGLWIREKELSCTPQALRSSEARSGHVGGWMFSAPGQRCKAGPRPCRSCWIRPAA